MPSITQTGLDLEERLRLVEERARMMELELDYQRRLNAISNAHMSAASKLVMWAVRKRILVLWHYDNAVGQAVEMHMSDLMSDTGLSADAVGKSVKALHAAGLVERTQKYERLKDGKIRTRVYVALTMLAYFPETAFLDESSKRNHGGDRVCKFCGSRHLTRITKVVCDDCHEQQEEEERTPVNAPTLDERLEAEEQEERTRPEVAVLTTSQPAPDLDEEEDDEPTEKRPVVKLQPSTTHEPGTSIKKGTTTPERPAKPTDLCKFCNVAHWTWYSEENWYICVDCYSPAPGRDITWTPF